MTTQDHLALAGVVSLEVDGEVPARTKEVYAEYKQIADVVDADTIAMRRVRDHLQDLDLAGIVQARTKNTGLQGGSHYVFELDADLEMTIDVLRVVDRTVLCDPLTYYADMVGWLTPPPAVSYLRYVSNLSVLSLASDVSL